VGRANGVGLTTCVASRPYARFIRSRSARKRGWVCRGRNRKEPIIP
jgi:hypothetical protein